MWIVTPELGTCNRFVAARRDAGTGWEGSSLYCHFHSPWQNPAKDETEPKVETHFVLFPTCGRAGRPLRSKNCELSQLLGEEIHMLKTFFLSDFI